MLDLKIEDFNPDDYDKIDPVFTRNTIVGDIVQWYEYEPRELFIVTAVKHHEAGTLAYCECVVVDFKCVNNGSPYSNLMYLPGPAEELKVNQYRKKIAPFSDKELSEIFV